MFQKVTVKIFFNILNFTKHLSSILHFVDVDDAHLISDQYACNLTFESLVENETWDLMGPPPGKRIIGCKWSFKAKFDINDEIQK